ncbi:hypothetical protein CARUB_v10002306mg [Capsella rubella]|uniref:Uncharacterized protein n=1 Tax=Capsella rubella TaxID=81985 RepID=R0GY64_9BRAS|nr:hypothetical protein CARUB_v10002306mg [Capsella rubella]
MDLFGELMDWKHSTETKLNASAKRFITMRRKFDMFLILLPPLVPTTITHQNSQINFVSIELVIRGGGRKSGVIMAWR